MLTVELINGKVIEFNMPTELSEYELKELFEKNKIPKTAFLNLKQKGKYKVEDIKGIKFKSENIFNIDNMFNNVFRG